MPVLWIEEPGAGPRPVEPGEAPFIIGRGRRADVRVRGLGVSRRHAIVTRFAEGYRVTDLGSRNGLVVDGRPVESAPLRDGSVLDFGVVRVVFRLAPEKTAESGGGTAAAAGPPIAVPPPEALAGEIAPIEVPHPDEVERIEVGDSDGIGPPDVPGSGQTAPFPIPPAGAALDGMPPRALAPAARRAPGRWRLRAVRRAIARDRSLAAFVGVLAAAGVAAVVLAYLGGPAGPSPSPPPQEGAGRPEGGRPRPALAEPAVPPAATSPAEPVPVWGEEGHGPAGLQTWARALAGDLLGRAPTAEEEAALLEAARSLPRAVIGELAIAYVVASAGAETGGLRGAGLAERLAGRLPRRADVAFFVREARESDDAREIAMAAWSLPALGPALPPPGQAGASAVVLCASGIDAADLFADPERFPATRALLRAGVAAIGIRPAADPRAAARALLAALAPSGEAAWLVVPRAEGGESVAGAGTLTGFGLWPVDGASHPALRRLVAVFGQPRPLPPGGWERVRAMRAALGAPVPEPEERAARALSEPFAADRDELLDAIERFIHAILRARRSRLIVAVLPPAPTDPAGYDGYLDAVDGLLGRLAPIARGEGWLFFASPVGRGTGASPGPGFALGAGAPFRSGYVIARPVAAAAAGATLARVLGRSDGGEAIEEMVRR